MGRSNEAHSLVDVFSGNILDLEIGNATLQMVDSRLGNILDLLENEKPDEGSSFLGLME